MQVAQLWRYPVKSLAGERVGAVELADRGIAGDRRLAAFALVARRRDQPLSARDVPRLLRFRGRFRSGSAEVSGPDLEWSPWKAEAVGSRLNQECGRELELREVPEGAFDDAPILLLHQATATALTAELGAYVDPRRFRANLYLAGEGIEAHQEHQLAGRELRCGTAVLEVLGGCPRCSVPTRDPDTWASWPQLLRHLVQTHDETVGAYCRVKVAGTVREDDPVDFG
ncbi:MAG TPA: MOSC domain-containing protein [Candidatus Dormibacteraeota bacterium]|nr:MOSC domain-containing protein [Candidatus Dormibacteraeota bacterium]